MIIDRVAFNDTEIVASEFGFGLHKKGTSTPQQVLRIATELRKSVKETQAHPSPMGELFQYVWCRWDRLGIKAATELASRTRLMSEYAPLQTEYSHNYAGTNCHYIDGWKKYISTEQRITSMWKALKIRSFERKRLLDLGCAGGRHLLQLAAHGLDVHGLEINPEYFNNLHPMLKDRVHFGDALLDTYWFKPDSFDIVICSAHGTIAFPEVSQLLSEIGRILVMNGVLLLDVPSEPLTIGPTALRDFRIYLRSLKHCGFKPHSWSNQQIVCTLQKKSHFMASI